MPRAAEASRQPDLHRCGHRPAPTADRETQELRAALEAWVRDLAPGTTGWLGTTAGTTEDGRAIAISRFESEEAGRRDAERPEQKAWWTETFALFDGEPTVLNSTDVRVDMQGDPDGAGFVQVIQGRVSDLNRVQQLMTQSVDRRAELRPDILGSLAIAHEGGAYTVVAYFTSEAEAREGERKAPPPEMHAIMQEMMTLNVEPQEFFDLKQPQLYSRK